MFASLLLDKVDSYAAWAYRTESLLWFVGLAKNSIQNHCG